MPYVIGTLTSTEKKTLEDMGVALEVPSQAAITGAGRWQVRVNQSLFQVLAAVLVSPNVEEKPDPDRIACLRLGLVQAIDHLELAQGNVTQGICENWDASELLREKENLAAATRVVEDIEKALFVMRNFKKT